MRYNKDTRMLQEAYAEATRRDFLKKTAGAIASTVVNTTGTALKAVAPKFSYDLSEYVSTLNDLKSYLRLERGMLTTKGVIPYNTPDDVLDAALEDTLKKAHAGKLPANIWNTILQNNFELEAVAVDTLEKMAWQKFKQYAGPYKNDPKAKASWQGNVMDLLNDEVFDGINDGYTKWEDLKHLIPAGDLTVNGKVVMSAADVVKNNILPSVATAAKNLEKYASGYTDWMKDFFVNPEGGKSEYEEEVEYYKKEDDKQYANNIHYSPADYKGGVDPDTPKLALDAYKPNRR